MQKDSRVLQKILELKKRPEILWIDELYKLNIWDDLEPFYKEINDHKIANTILAFIVLSYDASSEYLELTRDRIENKRKIMMHLAGPDCFSRELYLNAVIGDEGGILDRTIEWYVNRQTDWRWKTIIGNIEFHSRAYALSNGSTSVSDMKDSGATLTVADQRRERADQLIETIRKEFVELDDALEKEGRTKITERLKNDYSSWELFVLKNKNKAAAEEALAIEAKREKEERKNRKNKGQSDDDPDDVSPI